MQPTMSLQSHRASKALLFLSCGDRFISLRNYFIRREGFAFKLCLIS